MKKLHDLLLTHSIGDIRDSIINNEAVIISKIAGTKYYAQKLNGELKLHKPNHKVIDHIELVQSNLYVKQYQKCHKLKDKMTDGHIYEMVYTYDKHDSHLSSIKNWNSEYIIDPSIMGLKSTFLDCKPNKLLNHEFNEESLECMLRDPRVFFKKRNVKKSISGILIIGKYKFKIDNPYYKSEESVVEDPAELHDLMRDIVDKMGEWYCFINLQTKRDLAYLQHSCNIFNHLFDNLEKKDVNSMGLSRHFTDYSKLTGNLLSDSTKKLVSSDKFALVSYRLMLQMLISGKNLKKILGDERIKKLSVINSGIVNRINKNSLSSIKA